MKPPGCPQCDQPMVKRENRKDGTFFWGCRAYPDCRGTRPTDNYSIGRGARKKATHRSG